MYQFDKPDNLVELLEESVVKFSGNQLFGTKNSQGMYEWITYGEFGKRVDSLRAGLAGLGVGQGDTVGLIANNCAEWAVAAFASYGLGARYVPMYESELVHVWKYIIKDAAIKILFVANAKVGAKVASFVDEIESLEKIFVIDGEGDDSMSGLEAAGQGKPVDSKRPGPHDIAALIYTSGTTGDPKGVLLSHGNFTSNCQAGWHMYPELNAESRSLSILPWAHSYGETAELYNFIQIGGSVGFAEDVTTVGDDLQKVQPTHLIAVPRVFNKIYNGIWTKVNEEGGIKRKLFVMGVNAAKTKRELGARGQSNLGVNLKAAFADKVVFSKIRQKFGGRMIAAMTASATMNKEIAYFFFDIGIPVYDCYGLTETSPALTMNGPAAFKFGSVGKPIEKVKIVIDKEFGDSEKGDGEIIAYGPNIMQGYHNKPEQTAEVMTEDGGFRTGDLGRIDEEGFLHITGRIKEQYKLENGKYVFPATIEEAIKLLPTIANAMVYGDGRPYNICFIVPEFEAFKSLAARHGVSMEPKELIELQELQASLKEEIEKQLAGKFGKYEIPKKFVFLADDFSVENGMLTQTMKLKRRVVLEELKDKIEAQYA
jgi:long-chain acyl-CoA synthetase